MKKEIIYTEHYALIVSDEKIEEGSFIYETNIGEVSKVDKWYCEILEKGVKVEPFVKVIAHRPLTNAPILEGVPLLPDIAWNDNSKHPKYFECETITMNKGYTDKSDYPYQECEIPKTITNSQGQTELVGTFS